MEPGEHPGVAGTDKVVVAEAHHVGGAESYFLRDVHKGGGAQFLSGVGLVAGNHLVFNIFSFRGYGSGYSFHILSFRFR